MKQSAGLLPYRKTPCGPEYFLVHPGGPFFVNKDDGWWTIPKGEILPAEKPFDAAVREFKEETGRSVEGHFTALSPVIQKGGKKVFCWAVETDALLLPVVSNTFTLKWHGRETTFPEIDRAEWFSLETAKVKINERQAAFLDAIYFDILKMPPF